MMSKFSITLKSGKMLDTDNPKEVYYFFKSRGENIQPKKVKRVKRPKAE